MIQPDGIRAVDHLGCHLVALAPVAAKCGAAREAAEEQFVTDDAPVRSEDPLAADDNVGDLLVASWDPSRSSRLDTLRGDASSISELVGFIRHRRCSRRAPEAMDLDSDRDPTNP